LQRAEGAFIVPDGLGKGWSQIGGPASVRVFPSDHFFLSSTTRLFVGFSFGYFFLSIFPDKLETRVAYFGY